jgi:hypothetical protein
MCIGEGEAHRRPSTFTQPDSMFDYHFMLTYPPCAGTSLGTTQHTVTIMAERATDAYRRLWTTIDDMRRGGTGANTAIPDVMLWHGPKQKQRALLD